MKKTLLTVGLSTAVIFGLQAQETTADVEQEAQEEVIEARGNIEAEEENQSQRTDDAESTFSSEGMASIDKAQLPQEVMDSFGSSDFSKGTIERAYEIDGAALPQILESRASLSQYPGEQLPETLYIVHVNMEDGKGILYIGDDGESIASEKLNLDDSFSLFGNTEEEMNEAAQETEQAVDNASDEMEETAAQAEETVENAAQNTEEAVENTADEAEASAEEVGDEMEETVEEAGEETEQAIDNASNEIEASAEEADDEMEETAAQAEETAESAAQNTEEAVASAAGVEKNKMHAKADKHTHKITKKFDSKEMALVTAADLPSNVTESFENSDWSEGSIYKAYKIDGAAVSDILDERADLTIYAGEQLPESLYLLQVEYKDGLSFMYVGDDGEVYASEDL